jgi:POT family proton-dependent oligopeptide transporter
VDRRGRSNERLSSADWRVIRALIAIIAISVFQSTSYYQLYNVFKIWIQENVDLSVGGFNIPVPWYQSIDSLVAVAAVPALFGIWRFQASRRGEPGSVAKIGLGAWMAAGSHLILVAAILLSHGEAVHPVWPALCAAGMGIAFLYQWPTLLALVSRAAPAGINATMMGIAFISYFVSNILVGWIGGFYEHLSPVKFWSLHAAIAAGGGLSIMLFGRWIAGALEARPTRPREAT